MAKVFLKPRKARPFWFGHPWVFSGAIDRTRGRLVDGEVVELCDAEGRRIGEGWWNSRSQIRVRLVALDHEGNLDEALLLGRLERAVGLRRDLLRLPARTSAYRLVHSEGDGLPGLVVDVLGDHLVLQVSSLGLAPHVPALVERLVALLGPAAVLERPVAMAEEEGLEREGGVLFGEPSAAPLEVVEAGTRYLCDPASGQKTGFYSDQRENRIALAPLAAGRTVLDAFSYVGGFGLRMAREGAERVTLVDSSAPALELAREGAARNGVLDRVDLVEGNVLRVLDHQHREGRRYGLVVVDPPKLVHKQKDLRRGLRLYHEINTKALRMLEPGGVLVTCSCSQHVLPEHFDEMMGSVAKELGLRLQEIHRGGQGADHPVLLPLDESRYLDCRAYRTIPGHRPSNAGNRSGDPGTPSTVC